MRPRRHFHRGAGGYETNNYNTIHVLSIFQGAAKWLGVPLHMN